ncbi:MAG: serine hydrolase domain-containing protein [Microthrixaceae bacterium]
MSHKQVVRAGRPWPVAALLVVSVSVVSMLAASCAGPLLSGSFNPGGDSEGTAEVEASPGCDTPEGAADFGEAPPSLMDMDAQRLTDAVGYATARGAQSVRIYRHGCLVARSGLDVFTEDTPLTSWSMAKGVVSTVVGRAINLGYMSLDDPIGEYLDGLDAQHAALTVRQFLTQTTGMRMAWVNDLWFAGSGDSAADVLSRPFQAEPGTTFLYAQTAVTALVAVTEAAVGEDFQSFARRELFAPIGITDDQWRWARDGAGRTQGFAWLDMAPVAWARLGHLLLNEGMWGERRLIDEDFVREGSHGTAANAGYGFLWRTNDGDWNIDSGFPSYKRKDQPNWPGLPRDAFGYSGLFDQIMVVIPSLDMVILRMGLPSELFGDPIGESPGIRPSFGWRYNRLLMKSVTDVDVYDPGPWVYRKDDSPLDLSNIFAPDIAPFDIPAWFFELLGLGDLFGGPVGAG